MTYRPEDYVEPAVRYEVTLCRPVSETVTVDGDEAQSVEAAQEIAYQRAEGSLCHQCAKHLSLGDHTQDYVTEVRKDDGEEHEIIHDFEAQDLEARLTAVRNATLAEVADALAAISTTEPSGPIRNKLRDVAVKLRGVKMAGGKVDLR